VKRSFKLCSFTSKMLVQMSLVVQTCLGLCVGDCMAAVLVLESINAAEAQLTSS
jgi:hypothetical protein